MKDLVTTMLKCLVHCVLTFFQICTYITHLSQHLTYKLTCKTQGFVIFLGKASINKWKETMLSQPNIASKNHTTVP